MTEPALDLHAFAQAVYGGCSGFVEVAYIVRGKTRAKHIPVGEFLDDPSPLLELAQEGRDVYLGCTTLSEVPDKGRGKSSLRLDVPGAWLDLDLDVEGHHKPREDGLRQLASMEEAQELLVKCGLPEPTALVHSGGGLYAWWLYDSPLTLQGETSDEEGDESDRQAVVLLSESINAHVASIAAENGIGIDKVGDIVRILRPPGTYNWKRGAFDPRPVRLLYLEQDLRISAEELSIIVEDVVPTRQVTSPTVRSRSTTDEDRVPGLPDACRAATWEELLFPLGWTYGAPVHGATSFLRPGHSVDAGSKPGDGYGGSSGGDDGAKSAVVYTDGPENLVVFSDATGLPAGTGQNLTKFTVMSLIHFPHRSGERKHSWAAATRDLGQAALARLVGACCAVDESSAPTRSIWPASVLNAALEALGGGWKSSDAGWEILTPAGRTHVRKPRIR